MLELSVTRDSTHVVPCSHLRFLAAAILLPAALLTGCSGGGTPTVDVPSITPASGTYPSSITVAMLCDTHGASIYYTDSNSSGESTLYTGPFQVTSTETIKAWGVARGYNDSNPVFASYIIEVPAQTPVISPPSGSYAGPLTVTITDATPKAAIYYTTDGSVPTVSSNIYTGPLTVTTAETVEAVAIAPTYPLSAVATAVYTITSKHHTFACLSGCGLGTETSGVPSGLLQAMGWTDLHGNLWQFGGQSTLNGTTSNAQLWIFDLASDNWTEISGTNTTNTPGVYGTLGIAAATNIPGARFASFTWTDTAGNFWLFGGEGYDVNGTEGLLNDLWTYNPTTGFWTWIGGSKTVSASGVYGTLGTAAASNIPGAREAGVSWKDASGNFWLFGEHGVDTSGNKGALNDLWKFNPSTGQWTWVSGSSTAGSTPTYGALGVPVPTNTPGGYIGGSVGAIDAAGDLLFTSGTGASSNSASALLNTLWKFNPTTGQWTWLNGSDVGSVSGTYGVLGTPSTTNVPGSRQFGLGWTDTNGNLWSMGGNGIDSTGTSGYLNDFWQYDPVAGQWTWVAGSSTVNAIPVYGVEGFSSITNVSGSREYSVGWTGTDGSLYFFAGYGYDATGKPAYLGDLWRFTP